MTNLYPFVYVVFIILPRLVRELTEFTTANMVYQFPCSKLKSAMSTKRLKTENSLVQGERYLRGEINIKISANHDVIDRVCC